MSGLERPDTQESLRKMSEGFEQDRRQPFAKKLLNFQVFASTLLIMLVIITGTALNFALNSEQESRERNEDRREVFEGYVLDILTSVEKTQQRGVDDRDELMETIERIEAILDEHAEDGRIGDS